MPRSGSTWAFNVCRKLVDVCAPGKRTYSGYHEELAEVFLHTPPVYDHIVVKCHTLDPTGMVLSCASAVKIVYTHRDPYDAIASYMKMFRRPFEEALRAMKYTLELLAFHADCGNAEVLAYGDLTSDGRSAVTRVAKYLGFAPDPATITAIDNETSLREMKRMADMVDESSPGVVCSAGAVYDGRTLLHRGHIQNGGTDYGLSVLSDAERSEVAALLHSLPHEIRSRLQTHPAHQRAIPG
jgi:hypothetical protein